ncbi:hypothetical protein L208DRAFT_627056 [Tricholoma matsutake]|nr:hypothetical protein L208DRAFT_627056 [Tricholoma matsutake 945]
MEEESRTKKEREQGGKRARTKTRIDVQGWGDRSRSAGEILRERPGYESIYPAAGGGRGMHVGDVGEEEDERSVRLQGVPQGMGAGTGTAMGMGRQRSRSAGESMRYPRPDPQPQQRLQQDDRPGFEIVYHGVGVQEGTAAGERSMGLGRQRSRSAGEGIRSRLHSHPPPSADRHHDHDRQPVHLASPDTAAGVEVRAGNYQPGQEDETGMGKGMGRHRSRSAEATVIPSPPADPHEPAFYHTRSLALVDKNFRGKAYPHHLPNVQPEQRQSHPQHCPPDSEAHPQAHPQCHPQSQSMPRSILRLRECASGFDSGSSSAIAGSGTSTSCYRTPAANQGMPPPPPPPPPPLLPSALPSSHSRS